MASEDKLTDWTIARVAVDKATSGDTTLVTPATNRYVRVVSLFLITAGNVNVKFDDGASGTPLSGTMTFVAGTPMVLPHNDNGWFQTATGVLLSVNTSANVRLTGVVAYQLVQPGIV